MTTTQTSAKGAAAAKKAVNNKKPVPTKTKAVSRGKPSARRVKKEVVKQARSHPGVGAFVCGLLIAGKSTEEILNAVGKQFPDAQTKRASVSWYRSKLSKEGKL